LALTIRTRYLQRHAEPESLAFSQESDVLQLDSDLVTGFVLPIYDESVSALMRFLDMPRTGNLISVWVFNAPKGGAEDARRRTESALSHFIDALEMQRLNPHMYLARLNDWHRLIIIDHCAQTRLLPAKKAVGLARKIGADIVIAQLSHHIPTWLYFSDADAILPSDYFDLPSFESRPSACVLGVEHQAEQGLARESALYDFKLHYVAERLKASGSPYGYIALGSIIAIDVDDYCRVRGVPKKSAGEDFYLLNKLAKLHGVESIESPVVSVAGRLSSRVPFGTGQALEKMKHEHNQGDDYGFDSPKTFADLKYLYDSLEQAILLGEMERIMPSFIGALSKNTKLLDTLKYLGFDTFCQHAHRQVNTPSQFESAFHQWFDGFLTLKFVNHYRSHYYPPVSLESLDAISNEMTHSLKKKYQALITHR